MSPTRKMLMVPIKSKIPSNFRAVDHIQSTIATAEEAGVLSLARLWWRDAFPAAALGELANYEIGRQALYLSKVWNPTTEEVLVGVGDQLNGTQLLMYEDFGSADFALQVCASSKMLERWSRIARFNPQKM